MPEESGYTLRQTGSEIQQILDSASQSSQDISGKADRNYVDAALANKVDKVSGKGLSSNDFTAIDKQKLDGIQAGAQANVKSDWNATTGDAQILNKPDLSGYASSADLANKVDKVSGKGLSTNDYTTAEKNKLSGIASGAQANVIESIKVNGVVQPITDKTVSLTVAAEPERITDLEIDELFT